VAPSRRNASATCRFCGFGLARTFVDLGVSPVANAYLDPSDLKRGEMFYPLRAYVCEACLLVQLEEVESPEALFEDYAYFSSYSDTWLDHARSYVEEITRRLEMGPDHLVLEIASNDGYLLQYFVERGIPVLGVEPAANVAEVAKEKGIPTLARFFRVSLARKLAAEGRQADLIVANNVLAHVPALNDFVRGMKIALRPRGVVTVEFPHLMRLMEKAQFDTIYHEHFSYFSFLTVEKVFAKQGLTLFDVDEIPTHGGSLRIYGRHEEDLSRPIEERVEALRAAERDRGLDRIEGYLDFDRKVRRIKRGLLAFLIEARNEGKSVVGYGAPAKGNTLLNYCGIRTDLLDYTVDRSPHKQGRLLPGTRIPIHAPDRIRETRPDYVLILPWNLEQEITEQMAHVREWGGRFVVPIPEVRVRE
jgi:SAM-dependent methyltransferase